MKFSINSLSIALVTGIVGWGVYYLGLMLHTPSSELSGWVQGASILLMLSGLFAFFDLFKNTFRGGMRGLTLSAMLICAHLIILAINGYLRLLY